jgi:AraC-like DNA-binding protein
LILGDSGTMIRDMGPPAPRTPAPAARPTPGARVPRSHLTTLRGLPAVLEQFDVPSEPILRAAGLTRADLEDPERTASFTDLDRLIGTCVRRTKCTHFGLLMSRHVNLQTFGIAGRLALNAPSVGAALQDLAAYFVLHDSGGVPNVAIHDGTATFAYGIHAPGVRNSEQVYDLSVGAMVNIMRQLCGPRWRPDVLLLPRKRPPDLRPYREILAAPLRFDSVQAAVLFPAAWLSRPVANSDPLLHDVLADRATAALAGQDPLLHADVRRTIRLLLTGGDCSRTEVARRLGMRERTFGRRLQETGTTFQALLDEARLALAQQLLHDTRLPVARVASALGYHDPTVFTRAFRRWTGQTPRGFRASLATPD